MGWLTGFRQIPIIGEDGTSGQTKRSQAMVRRGTYCLVKRGRTSKIPKLKKTFFEKYLEYTETS
jgi:hypothetical protein